MLHSRFAEMDHFHAGRQHLKLDVARMLENFSA